MSILKIDFKSLLSRMIVRYSRDLFDSEYYLRSYPDVAAAKVDPYSHFLRHGERENRQPNELFNPQFYMLQVGSKIAHPVSHYLRSGAKSGLDPHPLFDSRWYLEAYPDVRNAKINPLVHYIRHGRKEGRQTAPEYRQAFGLKMPAAMGYTFPNFNRANFNIVKKSGVTCRYHEQLIVPLCVADIGQQSVLNAFSAASQYNIPIDVAFNVRNDSFATVYLDLRSVFVEISQNSLTARYHEAALFRVTEGRHAFAGLIKSGSVELTS